jgi:uncharacterized membrane protein YadS
MTALKLIRNTLMGPLILLIAWWWGPHEPGHDDAATRRRVAHAFPLFLLGFLALALARTAGLIDASAAASIDEVARLCIVVALAGVGLSTRLAQLRAVGATPFCLGLGTSIVLAALSLALITIGLPDGAWKIVGR